MDLLNLGYIINTHGLDGTLVIFSNTHFASERYVKDAKLFLMNPISKEVKEVTVMSYRKYKEYDYVKFLEIDNKDEAIKFKGYTVEIKKEEAIIPEGYYRFDDLKGCKIITTDNKYLGVVIQVEEFPAQVTLRVKKDNGKTFFVPFIDKVFIQDVDVKNKTITIKYMEGMC